jgi:hypothetical protein
MSLAKRILSSFVSLTTVLSTVGTGMLALPHGASAATLASGDLIKASGPTVYYYASDARRYVFPNETTFFSWFPDFSSVKTITDAELAAISLGGNLTIRPGTKLVKITTDPKVYAVAPGGVLRWVESESIATSLYGSAWARRVVDVADSYFTNYATGPSLSTAVHPDGTLISYAGDSARYVVMGGMKRKFNPDSAFAANWYNAANVIQTTIGYPNGSDVTGREAMLADAIYRSGSVTPVAGNLMVALASDTPARATLPQGSSGSQLAKFNFTAGSADVRVTGLRVHRVGVGATSDFSNIYLYDTNGMRLTTGRTINSVTQTVDFNGLNWTVPAGQTWSLVVVGDVKGSITSGGEHTFELMDAASVIVAASTTATIGGSFPVRGNSFVIGTTSAARLDVQKGTQPSNPNVGAMQAEVSNFKLTANTNDVRVRRVTLYQGGNTPNTDLRNFKLYQGSTLVAEAAGVSSNNQIVLNFTGEGYDIPNGVTRVFSLKADVGGRSANTIKTYVEYSSDVMAIDRVYGSGVLVCNGTSTSGCTSSNGSFDGTGSNHITLTTQGGQLTVAYNGPGTSNVAKGQNNVVFMRFALSSQSSNLEVRNLRIAVGSTNGGLVATGTSSYTDYIRNVRVRDMSNGQVLQGPTSASGGTLDQASSPTTSTFLFNNSIYVNAGQTRNFEVLVDLYNTDNSDFIGKKYRATLNAFQSGDVRVVDTNEQVALTDIVPNTAINANEMTIQAGSLTVALSGSPASTSVVKRQADIPALGINFTAGGQSEALVTALTLVGTGDISGTWNVTNFVNVISACSLYNGTTQVGQSRVPDSNGVMSFTNLNWTVARGTTGTLTAKCTADSVIVGDSDRFAVGVSSITAQDQDSNTLTVSATPASNNVSGSNTPSTVIMTVQNAGTVSLNADNMPQSTILVAGKPGMMNDTWHRLAQYRVTAQYEDMSIERVMATSSGLGLMYREVAVAVNGAVRGTASFSGGASSSKDIFLTSPIVVPKDGSVVIQLMAKLNPIVASSSVQVGANAARSGQIVRLGIASNNVTDTEYDSSYATKFNVRVTGQASGERVYIATTTATILNQGLFGNSHVVRATKPTVSRVALTSTNLVPGNASELYRFNVQADSMGPVAVKKVTFRVAANTSTSQVSSFSLSNFKVLKGTLQMNTNDYNVVNAYTGVSLKNAVLQAPTTTYVVVSFTDPQVIDANTSQQFALKADVNNSVSGDIVSTSFATQSDGLVYTGYLTVATTTLAGTGINLSGPNLAESVDGTGIAAGTFVWSDVSDSAGGTATSGDWTDDLYLQDLTDSQSLSRNS